MFGNINAKFELESEQGKQAKLVQLLTDLFFTGCGNNERDPYSKAVVSSIFELYIYLSFFFIMEQ